MKTIRYLFAVIGLSVLSAATTTVLAAEPPTSAQVRAGFGWRDLSFAKVQSPVAWHTKSESGSGTRAAFISKEVVEPAGKFRTGLSINLIENASARVGMPAVVYAKGLTDKLVATKQNKGAQTFDAPPLRGYSLMVRSEAAPGDFRIVQYVILGNEKTGAVWVTSFEAPESEWSDAWKIGQVMLQSLDVDEKL